MLPSSNNNDALISDFLLLQSVDAVDDGCGGGIGGRAKGFVDFVTFDAFDAFFAANLFLFLLFFPILCVTRFFFSIPKGMFTNDLRYSIVLLLIRLSELRQESILS